MLISGFTIYFIWTYFDIAKGINEISINLKTNEVDILNLDRIYSQFCKPVRIYVDAGNRVLKKRKRFSRYSKNFRIYIEAKGRILTLIDIEDDYTSEKFKFALNFLMTTNHAAQQEA